MSGQELKATKRPYMAKSEIHVSTGGELPPVMTGLTSIKRRYLQSASAARIETFIDCFFQAPT